MYTSDTHLFLTAVAFEHETSQLKHRNSYFKQAIKSSIYCQQHFKVNGNKEGEAIGSVLTYRMAVWNAQSLHSHRGRLDESRPSSGLWRELRTWGSWFRPYWGRKPANVIQEVDDITPATLEEQSDFNTLYIGLHFIWIGLLFQNYGIKWLF